jgi:hypothetical protein
LFTPPVLEFRGGGQRSKDYDEPFESQDMEKILLPNAICAALKKTLNKYGVDRFSLFPGLDSLAAHLEWLQSKGY